jgi:tetratricopeptide (TPR) repeat protein
MSTDTAGEPDWQTLSPLLDEALQLPQESLGPWLATLQQRDSAVAERLRQLLANRKDPSFTAFLSGAPPLPASELPPATLIDRTVGSYVIDAELGRGGMGTVWRARRADGLYEGYVAIKFLNVAWVGRAGEQRFKLEGRLLARLHHANIASLLDAGVLDGTQPYLVLEYVDGEPIDAYCERHRFNTEQRIRLFLDVISAVAHAHRNLIVHRDLKPANVFVTADGTVKLLDFGIAKLMEGDNAATQTGFIALTPDFAAPEQLAGEPVTTATDVYGLGLILFVLLSGSLPFPADRRAPAERLRAVLTDLPRLASGVAQIPWVSARSLVGDLDNILRKALKRDPLERYPSAGAFAEDLQRVLAHQPVLARTDSVVYRLEKFVRRHRGGVAAGVLMAAAIVAGLVGTLVQAHRATVQAARAAQQAHKAQLERDRALRELTYSEAANEFVKFLLGEGVGKPFTTIELLARADQLVNTQFERDSAPRADLQLMIGDTYGLAGDSSRAQDILKRARESAAKSQDVSLQATIDCTLGDVDADAGDISESKELFANALGKLRAQPEPDAGALANCLTSQGDVQALLGDGPGALASAQEALKWLGTPRPGQRTLAVDAHAALGEAYSRLGDLRRAIAEYNIALSMLKSMGREHTAQAAVQMVNLAEKYSKAGRAVEATEAYGRAFEVSQLTAGPDNASPLAEANYASALWDVGQLNDSLAHFTHALAVAERHGQKLWAAYIYLLGAPALCDAHELQRCGAWLSAARSGLTESLPPGHASFGVLELNTARLADKQGASQLACDHLRRALEIFGAATEPRPSQVIALEMLTRCSLQLGDHKAAQRAAEQAMAKAQAMLNGFTHTAWLGRALLARAIVLEAEGERSAALPVSQEALLELQEAVGPNANDTREAQAMAARLGAASNPTH